MQASVAEEEEWPLSCNYIRGFKLEQDELKERNLMGGFVNRHH